MSPKVHRCSFSIVSTLSFACRRRTSSSSSSSTRQTPKRASINRRPSASSCISDPQFNERKDGLNLPRETEGHLHAVGERVEVAHCRLTSKRAALARSTPTSLEYRIPAPSAGSVRRNVAAEPHEHYMRMALALAEEAYTNNEVPVGALLVVRNGPETDAPDVILARGRNRIEECCDATAHAEIECLRAASARLRSWRLNRAGSRDHPVPYHVTLYCTLEPCAMCLSAMQLARVTRLVYGAPGLRLGAIESYVPLLTVAPPHPFHRFSEIIPGVLANESASLLRRFFRERRKCTESIEPTALRAVREERSPGVGALADDSWGVLPSLP
jgi:tRNA(adenine34) deaminase